MSSVPSFRSTIPPHSSLPLKLSNSLLLRPSPPSRLLGGSKFYEPSNRSLIQFTTTKEYRTHRCLLVPTLKRRVCKTQKICSKGCKIIRRCHGENGAYTSSSLTSCSSSSSECETTKDQPLPHHHHHQDVKWQKIFPSLTIIVLLRPLLPFCNDTHFHCGSL